MSDASEPFWIAGRILHVRCGSRAYGVETPQSDWDSRGVCIPPKRYLLGLERFEQHHEPGDDHVTFALDKFARLALEGNPNILEALFTDGADLLAITPLGERLVAERESFLSRRVADRFCGYARAQLARIRRHRRWIEDPPQEPDPNEFGGREEEGRMRWPHAQAQQDFRAAHKRWQDYRTWRKRRNPKRAALEEAHGYDTKHAMHLCRLLTMGSEILRTGEVRVRRPDAAWLKEVRAGSFAYEELLAWAEAQEAEVRGAVGTSPLPAEPDREGVEALVIELHERFLAGER